MPPVKFPRNLCKRTCGTYDSHIFIAYTKILECKQSASNCPTKCTQCCGSRHTHKCNVKQRTAVSIVQLRLRQMQREIGAISLHTHITPAIQPHPSHPNQKDLAATTRQQRGRHPRGGVAAESPTAAPSVDHHHHHGDASLRVLVSC